MKSRKGVGGKERRYSSRMSNSFKKRGKRWQLHDYIRMAIEELHSTRS